MALRRRARGDDPGPARLAARPRGRRGARRRARPRGAGRRRGAGDGQAGSRAPARALARHRPRLRRPAGAAPRHPEARCRPRPRFRRAPAPPAPRCRARRSTTTACGWRGSRPWPTPSSAPAVAIVILVLVATGLAVAFATRGAMAGNREVVDVLHFVGADDDFIAREFQRRFFRLGLKGGLAGGGLALLLITLCGFLLSAWRGEPHRRPDRGPVRRLRGRLAGLCQRRRGRAHRLVHDRRRDADHRAAHPAAAVGTAGALLSETSGLIRR